MSIALDLSQLPWVLARFDGEQTIEELEVYIRQMDEVHARKRPYAAVTWMKRYARTRAHTERMGRWMIECEEATRALCVGAGLISQSPIFRFTLSTVFLF